jgi:hypothetical protein
MRVSFSQVRLETVEAAVPELSVGLEPGVELDERLGSEPVQPALPVHPDGHQPGLAEDAQVLRHEGLADAEREDQLADGRLAPPERVQEVAPTRFGEDLQHVGHL